jgi:hypothetical protein
LKTIWVLENIRGDRTFYDKFDLQMMFASVIQWKKHHPTYECSLYGDKLTLEVVNQLGGKELWDNHTVLKTNKNINKNVFWASSKLQVLREVEEPCIIMDNDFLVYTSFKKFFKNKVIVSHIEDGLNYYIMPTDHFAKKVKHLLNRYKQKAVNCSFLYFPDPKFMNYYAMVSLDIMTELTRAKAPNSKYLILAEQLLLKHLLDLNKVPHIPLVDREYVCVKDEFDKKIKGLIQHEKQHLWFRHYWMDKSRIKKSKKGFSLKEESQALNRLIRSQKVINWKVLC